MFMKDILPFKAVFGALLSKFLKIGKKVKKLFEKYKKDSQKCIALL